MLGAFYNALGNQSKTEKCYFMYIKMIEKFYSPTSLEVSNAFFLMGVYYSEKGPNFIHKSIACFGKSLAIREKKFGNSDSSCADCLVNMGILYKK